jgi:GNAT superfamily N-acetyltransferase
MENPDLKNTPENKLEVLSVSIEKATLDDLKDIQSLNQELCTKENVDFDPTIDPQYPFTQKGEEYFRSRIEASDGLSLIVREGNEAVAYLVGGMVMPEDYRSVKTIAELENMYVRETMRGKGIGGKLIQQFEDWCKTNNVERIRIVASAQNNQALKFYEAHGAKPVSVTLEKALGTN